MSRKVFTDTRDQNKTLKVDALELWKIKINIIGEAFTQKMTDVCLQAAAAVRRRGRRRGSRLGSGRAVAAVGLPAQREPWTWRGGARQLPAALRPAQGRPGTPAPGNNLTSH